MISVQKKHFLVCGGAGFMGSNFIHYILNQFSTVRITNCDALMYAGNKENYKGMDRRVQLVHGDICDTSLMKALMHKADFVINFAAETHVDRSIHGSSAAFVRSNVIGVHSLLEALRANPHIKKMIHVSTDEVWGDLSLNARRKFNESSPFLPNSPYAATKAAGDLLIRSYVQTYKLPIITTHSVNNFGPRQFPEKLIPFFVLRAARDLSLPLYGDGKNIRDWIYVDDHTKALIFLLTRGILGEVYAISNNDEHANIDIAHKILRILKKPKSLITFINDRPGHDRRYSVDSRKLRRLGWRTEHLFDAALKRTIQWYQENPQWFRAVAKRRAGINTHILAP